MPVSIDKYTQALIKTKVVIDAVSNVTFDGKPLEVTTVNFVRKVVLPGKLFAISVDDLVVYGAKVLGARGRKSGQSNGGQARWAENLEQRQKDGLPPNVYAGNARSIEYAREKGNVPPAPTFIGRRAGRMTETYPTVAEVVTAMNEGRWRTEFAKGQKADEARRRLAKKTKIR